jgi:hypothetical protein
LDPESTVQILRTGCHPLCTNRTKNEKNRN